MTPYGIVYSDNVLSFNESKKQWMKKTKIINAGIFTAGYLFIVALLAVLNFCIIKFSAEPDLKYTASLFISEAVLSVILLYLTVRKNKETSYAQNCFNEKEKKQIVLREFSAVFTAPYRQSEYYYDEIEQVVETDNTITIFFDSKYGFPVYISKNTVEKGDIAVFKKIFTQKMGSKYVFSGGGR